jgi:hypothetical protein
MCLGWGGSSRELGPEAWVLTCGPLEWGGSWRWFPLKPFTYIQGQNWLTEISLLGLWLHTEVYGHSWNQIISLQPGSHLCSKTKPNQTKPKHTIVQCARCAFWIPWSNGWGSSTFLDGMEATSSHFFPPILLLPFELLCLIPRVFIFI